MQLTIIKKEWDLLSKAERRSKILELEKACLELQDSVGITIEPKHTFCNGVYAREVTIPKGATAVGAIHLKEHINILSKGKIVVATDEGVEILEAPCTFISPVGVKRVGHVLEEAVWTTIHATESTDVDEIKQECIAPSYEALNKIE